MPARRRHEAPGPSDGGLRPPWLPGQTGAGRVQKGLGQTDGWTNEAANPVEMGGEGPDPPTLVSGGPSSHEWPRVSPFLRAAVAAFENGHDRPLRTAAPCSGPESCPTLCDPTARQAPPPCTRFATQRQSPRAWLRGDMLELILWPSRPGWRAGCCGMLPANYHPAAPLSPQMGKLRPRATGHLPPGRLGAPSADRRWQQKCHLRLASSRSQTGWKARW